jgi:hypothetical protein
LGAFIASFSVSVAFQKDEEDEIVVPVAGGNTWQATARSNPDAAARLEQVCMFYLNGPQ